MKLSQNYENYTPTDFQVWQQLFDRQMHVLPIIAPSSYLDGIKILGFTANSIPNFTHVNTILKNNTGWQIEVVPGFIAPKVFFGLLAAHVFPAARWLRTLEHLDYSEEPDMFHDVFGYLPLLTNSDFCKYLHAYGTMALKYIDNPYAVQLLSRFYGFTVEFGLITKPSGTKIYGAGILSSVGESTYCLGNIPTRHAFNVEKMIADDYHIDSYQDHYFVIESYRQLFDSLPMLEEFVQKQLMTATN